MRPDECRWNPDRSWSAGVWLAYRGWSILLLAPLCALIAAFRASQPLLANWTQTFMSNAAGFVAQFFPIFLFGALFGKLMEASGAVEAIAKCLTERLGTKRAMLAIVLAGACVTYGGVRLTKTEIGTIFLGAPPAGAELGTWRLLASGVSALDTSDPSVAAAVLMLLPATVAA